MTVMHPGLPLAWAIAVWLFMLVVTARLFLAPAKAKPTGQRFSIDSVPWVGDWLRSLMTNTWPLRFLKVLFVALFLVVIVAGLFGAPLAERNLATVLTWNLWWTGLIIAVFFMGTAWCAVCPWDTMASWLVRRRLWRRAHPNNSLNLRVPKPLRNIWPALLLLIGLTWLELGVGVTTVPYATALLALLMMILATTSLALFERRAFCRYFCPVGRTVGAYAQLAAVELRPIESDLCAQCTTLECYHGDKDTEPCPTHLVMGRLKQSTYCTSCGNCTQSCPHQNVAWRLRSPSVEAMQEARPHWDEAWFMLGLLALTTFHGLTMLSVWEEGISALARFIGDSGRLLWSFSIGMTLSMAVPIVLYALMIRLTRWLVGVAIPFKRLFSTLAFLSLPLAFAYHLAHNLTHLVRESDGLSDVMINPLGTGTLPLGTAEIHARHVSTMISQDTLFAIQAGLLAFGFWIAVKVIQGRGRSLLSSNPAQTSGWALFPMFLFAVGVTGLNMWLMMQPMTMRLSAIGWCSPGFAQ